ncbi:response regulator transcription factor [Paenibacillus sacheonensis]|uniref:Response regulator n=1 Tax=Paenibacillus sacheonensis TaxID=742054 RepID=A0A7X5C2C2_9BACL|nr:response regulator [Paenibacillus sacheonensis]MBM7565026.1 two-component system response regulator YesN [Paenibacillus sacheonensis]NBC70189.1 response regulator [Paenibacillus sacheonensis]
MYNLLVVDDEKYAVEAILSCIDWASIGVTGLFSAYGVGSAKEKLLANEIDIIVCDIEMPGSNGLELLEWVNEHKPNTLTIFFTGHANFAYAQQALQLGSFDYLLKPVKHKQIADVVSRACEKLQQERDKRQYSERYEKYAQLWETQKPLLWEKFWQDVLGARVMMTEERLGQAIEAYGLPIEADTRVRPILLSVEEFREAFSKRDEEILEYALLKSAEEMFLESRGGCIIRDASGILFVLLYEDEHGMDPQELTAVCRTYMKASSSYFYCRLSCYVGEPSTIGGLTGTYHALLEMEQSNVAETEAVLLLRDHGFERGSSKQAKEPANIDWAEWTVLFESGKKAELMERLNAAFKELAGHPVTNESLEAVYYLLLHMVYHVSHRKGWPAKEVVGSKLLSGEGSATRSLPRLKSWAERLLTAGMEYFSQHEGDHRANIEKVKKYIGQHIRDVNREDLAAHVYLNSAYLSRLFKKETGQSLMDFIILAKINQAKILLTESNQKISDIGDSLGYENFSYFGKVFKKTVGISPQEYRKRYQGIVG